MPLYVPVPAVALEGDFSDWTVYDRFVDDDAQQTLFGNYAIVNEDEDKILLIDAMNLLIRSYDIPTKVLTEPAHEYWLPGMQGQNTQEGAIKSVLGTYMVSLIYGANVRGNGVRVHKNGALVKTLTEADMGITANRVVTVSISPSGKYIIVSGWLTAEADMGWVVLEGS